MREIKFLAFYNTPDNPENHIISPAASTKVGYLINALENTKRPVEVITGSRPYPRTGNPKIEKQLNDYAKLVIMPEIRGGGWFANKVSSLVYYIRYIGYLMRHIRKEDIVIVYHSLQNMKLVELLKKWIGFCLILEVEEIYGDVMQSQKTVHREMRYFQCADGYIFPTELLNQKVNTSRKPYVVAHGTYQVEAKEIGAFPQTQEKTVRCVYAGTFDPAKGGVMAAISAAEHLPENYHMHILGFGSSDEVKRVEDFINTTAERCRCGLTYDGCLSGDAYKQFIQSCDIGLSTQNPSAMFNDTSFPSKVLSYMANGLRVVSVRIPVVEESAVGDLVSYYDEQTPERIAKAIMQIDLTRPYDSRARLSELDVQFREALNALVTELMIE